MSRSSLEAVVKEIYSNYVQVKDVHEAACALNPEYKRFWDNHSEEDKSRLLRGQTMNSVVKGVWKYHEIVLHATTLGASYGIKKLLSRGKPPREEMVRQAVTNEAFTAVLVVINSIMESQRALEQAEPELLFLMYIELAAEKGFQAAKEFVEEIKKETEIH